MISIAPRATATATIATAHITLGRSIERAEK